MDLDQAGRRRFDPAAQDAHGAEAGLWGTC